MLLFCSHCFADRSNIREKGFLSVAVRKCHGQRQLKQKFVLAYGSKEESITAEKAWHGIRARKLANHISARTQEAEKVNRKQAKAMNQHCLPPVLHFIQQDFTS